MKYLLVLLLAGCSTTSDSGANFCLICFGGHVKTTTTESSPFPPDEPASGTKR